MPRQRTHMVSVLLLLLGTGCLAEPEWEPLVSQEGRFQVEMPGSPTYESRELATPAGNITAHHYLLETKGGRVAYFIMYADYPEIALMAGPEVVLEGASEGAFQNSGMTRTSESNLDVEGGTGKELTGVGTVNGNDVVLRSRIYLYDNRLYQVMVLSAKELAAGDDIEPFFRTFQVVQE